MIRNACLAAVLLLSGLSARADAGGRDDGVMVLGPVRRPVPVIVPDGATVIFGGMPPIAVGADR